MANNEELLKQIRKRFDYATNAWRDIRSEAATDRRYSTGDPWDPLERKQRKEKGRERPVLAFDELNQYLNQLVNTVRMNKRAIKVAPQGNGANDQTAELRQAKIREIEYRSNALAVYSTAFEDAARGSYGYCRINKRYVDEKSFDQELYLTRIANPDTVLMDPDFKEADASDIQYCFIIDKITRDEFKRQWPKATTMGFIGEALELAPQWIGEDSVQIAEYWYIEKKKRTLVLANFAPAGAAAVFVDECGQGAKLDRKMNVIHTDDGPDIPLVLDEYGEPKIRESESHKVMQCITNGVEILEDEIEWDGKYIPVAACLGQEIWVDEGAGARRKLLSLVRLARDPYMAYCYARSTQTELVGMSPKTPYVGYEGQFENHEDEWQNVNRSPVAYIEAKATIDAVPGQLLPPPQQTKYEPPIQALEMYAEACRRGVQAAMGITPLPSAAQRRNEKSGVALEKIQQQESIGTFHFVDNFDRFLMHTGRIIEDLLDKTYDTPRETSIVNVDESVEVVRINEPSQDKGGNDVYHRIADAGDHQVTVSTGPSFQSQREEAGQFVDTLVQNIAALPVAPPQAAKILALAIQMKDLGPKGDEIAEIISPTENQPLPPQAQAIVAQAQQQVQLLQQALTEMQQKLQEATNKVNASILDNASRERIALMTQRSAIIQEIIKSNMEERNTLIGAHLERLNMELKGEQDAEATQQEEVADTTSA